MNLDLARVLHNTRRGQWSVDDFDWSQPLQGAGGLTAAERREAGLALLFTAGLERQAARVFGACADYIDEPHAAEIYQLFAADELRHAEAEIRLAARYGVSWDDQPATTRWMFRTLGSNFDRPNRALHEISAATILLFELALDSILIPALKERVSDPLQAEVFRRIDLDESRHLAMDYWLLDYKGRAQAGHELRDILEAEDGARTLWQRAYGRFALYRTMVAFLTGFGTNALVLRNLGRDLNDPIKVARYLDRVRGVTDKAPHALDAPAYRMGLRGQAIILRVMGRLLGRQLDVVP
ncbi:MAG TPA: hypothetical protein VML75_18745 [Kofleriaceae bacterium]|nr:hypothetical protein [Kofleriaceae bacterium]